ncbi:hypothetical protein L1887_16945 [Cichorium endivia]|nr:hypothetical protein L1887_16945 [Cichorium endivia]
MSYSESSFRTDRQLAMSMASSMVQEAVGGCTGQPGYAASTAGWQLMGNLTVLLCYKETVLLIKVCDNDDIYAATFNVDACKTKTSIKASFYSSPNTLHAKMSSYTTKLLYFLISGALLSSVSARKLMAVSAMEVEANALSGSFGIGAGANMGRGGLLGGAIPGMNTGVAGGVGGSFGTGVGGPGGGLGGPGGSGGLGQGFGGGGVFGGGGSSAGQGFGGGGVDGNQGFGGGGLDRSIGIGGGIGTGNTGLGNAGLGGGIGGRLGVGGGGIGSGGVGGGECRENQNRRLRQRCNFSGHLREPSEPEMVVNCEEPSVGASIFPFKIQMLGYSAPASKSRT